MAGALVLVAVLMVSFVFTSLADQVTRLAHDFPSFRGRIDQRLPAQYPMLKRFVGEVFSLPYSPEVATWLRRPLELGTTAISGVMAVFFTLILTLYFLLDGRRLYAWLLAFIPRRHSDKMADTVEEFSEVVYAYVRGQVITSLLFSIYVAIVLSVFRVPAAIPLALLAGFCDVIPVVGIIIATVPATLLALTVSPMAALAVLSFYVVYHLVESYFIVPRIYRPAVAPIDPGGAAGPGGRQHAGRLDRRGAGLAAGGGLSDRRAHLAGPLPEPRGHPRSQGAGQVGRDRQRDGRRRRVAGPEAPLGRRHR